MLHLFASLEETTDRIMLYIGLIGWSCMFGIEMIAMRVEGFSAYLKKFWNFIDLMSIVYPIYVCMMITTNCV